MYSDCCTLSDETIKSNKGNCDADNTIECHVKHYGIYCCDDNVKKAMRLYADISSKIVRLHLHNVTIAMCNLMHLHL